MKLRTKLALGAATTGVALAALAIPSFAQLGATSTAPAQSDKVSAKCSYPPVSAPRISLSSEVSRAYPLRPFTLYGQVTVNTCGLNKRAVGLYRASKVNGTYIQVGLTSTNSTGAYSFTTALLSTSYYKAVTASGGGYNSATSTIVTVTKR